MNETQTMLDIEIGTKEAQKLMPKPVKIVKVEIVKVGEKGNEKVICFCKHPDKQETISISSAKIERNNKVEIAGLWLNKDEDGKIRKGSVLAIFMNFMMVITLKQLEGRNNILTIADEEGYLAFKAY